MRKDEIRQKYIDIADEVADWGFGQELIDAMLQRYSPRELRHYIEMSSHNEEGDDQ